MAYFGRLLIGLIVGFALLSVVFWFIERRWPALPRRPRAKGATLTDIIWWFTTPFSARLALLVAAVVAAIVIAFAFGVPAGEGLKRFFDRDTAIGRQPLWLQTIEIIVLLDLASYWGHRWFHRVKPLWPFHAVHHSSEWVDWLASVRVHPVNEIGMKLLQAAPLLVLGFNFTAVSVAAPVLTVYAIFIHANVPFGFGPMRYVFATPVFHRWHHTSQEEGLDRNFSGGFVWPDMLFGTFYLPKGKQPERFGLFGERVPENFWSQLGWGFRGFKKPATQPSPSPSTR